MYKAWSGLGGRMLEFHDVHLKVGETAFHARVQPEEVRFEGRFVTVLSRWVALVVVTTES